MDNSLDLQLTSRLEAIAIRLEAIVSSFLHVSHES